jgi:hypothetical protein
MPRMQSVLMSLGSLVVGILYWSLTVTYAQQAPTHPLDDKLANEPAPWTHRECHRGARLLAQRGGLALPPFPLSLLQPTVFIGVIVLGTLVGLIPAILAYRTEVAENLAPLS